MASDADDIPQHGEWIIVTLAHYPAATHCEGDLCPDHAFGTYPTKDDAMRDAMKLPRRTHAHVVRLDRKSDAPFVESHPVLKLVKDTD